MGTLLHSCAKVREPIKLSFGVVSVAGPGIGVLDGVNVVEKERAVSWGFSPIGVNAYLVNRSVFNLCMKN